MKKVVRTLLLTMLMVALSGVIANAAKPKFSTFKVTYSGKASSLKAGSGKYIQIKVKPKSKVKTTTEIAITDAKGKVVYQKTYDAAKNKTRTLKWNGKPSAGNAAGLSTASYVPTGKYKVKVTIKNADKKQQKATKTKTVKVTAPAASSGSGSVTQWGSKIYLTDPVTDYMAEEVCRKVLKKSMSTKEKMKRLYEYVTKLSIHYSSKKQVGKIDFKLSSKATQKAIADMTAANQKLLASGKAAFARGYAEYYGEEEDGYSYAPGDEEYWGNYFLETGQGDCIGVSYAYAVLLWHIGVEAEQIEGASVGGRHHIWNIVNYNGKWYFCDCDAENDNYTRLKKKDGKLEYAFFLKGTKLFKGYGFKFDSSVKINGKTVTIQKSDVK